MLQILDDTTRNTQQQWLKFLLERVGHNNLPLLLEYYESIGWISIDVADRLLALAEAEKVKYFGSSWTLSPEEHRTSMLFIEKLLGCQVDISLFPVARSSRASIVQTGGKPRESYIEAHQQEKEELEFAVQRRDITIKNLEQEMEKRDLEMGKLRERLDELEGLYDQSMNELRYHRVYRKILEENVNLRKVILPGNNVT